MHSDKLGVAAVRSSEGLEPETAPQAPLTFDQLGLTPELLRAVASQGYTEPTPVQAQSIPIVLAGRDLLAGAQTGTGKTAAFVLPILQLLNTGRPTVAPESPGRRRPRSASGLPIRCLVLTPTRELALQIEESVRTYGSERPIGSTTIYGGVGFQPQVSNLRNGPEIVVATPGRLLDHAGQGTIDLSKVEILVLDEADRMLDMGFIRDIRRILELMPAVRQNLLFSATFSDEIRELADGFLQDPEHVQIARRNAPIELVRQVVYPVDRERKRELLSHLIRTGRIDRALVFTRTKHGANRLAEQLEHDGIAATAIHGNKSQGQRVRALDDFKAGRASILVATEVAARGIDIDGLPHVVNFELPMVAQDYVHRIGRTGRAGMEGDAVSLVCVDENLLLGDIEKLLRQRITREVIAGFEVDPRIPREPIRQRTMGFRPNEGRRAPAVRPAAPIGIAADRRPAMPRPATPAPRPVAPAPRPAIQAGPAPRPAAPAGFVPARQDAARGPRPAAPAGFVRPASSGPRQSVAPAGGFRRPIPADFRQSAQSRPRPSAPQGFNQSSPVEPRRPATGGFRRPSEFRDAQQGDTRRPAPTGYATGGYTTGGYAPARRPAAHYDSAASRPGTGRPPTGFRRDDRRDDRGYGSPQREQRADTRQFQGEPASRTGNRSGR